MQNRQPHYQDVIHVGIINEDLNEVILHSP